MRADVAPATNLPCDTHRRYRHRLSRLAAAGCCLLAGCGDPQAEVSMSPPAEQDQAAAALTAETKQTATAPPAGVRAGSIRTDILLVNSHTLSTAEVLYPVHEEIAELKQRHAGVAAQDAVARLVARETQQAVGILLLFDEAWGQLSEPQREVLDQAVERELEGRIARRFGGSRAAFQQHLEGFGLSYPQLRDQVRAALVVRTYTRERIVPRVHLRRDDLLTYYAQNKASLATPETRELYMIAVPFERYLPAGQTWSLAVPSVQRQAKLAALRAAREALVALKARPFGEVARQYSGGLLADEGGAWGAIGQPLNPPYDEVTAQIFSFGEGQVSEPVEVNGAWCIVKCGRIQRAHTPGFAEAQDTLRERLTEERFNELSAEHLARLAERASISDTRAFMIEATRRALQPDWPPAQGLAD